jgi:hypothetical protein
MTDNGIVRCQEIMECRIMFLKMRKMSCLDDFWCFGLAFIDVVEVIVITLVIYYVCIANLDGTVVDKEIW